MDGTLDPISFYEITTYGGPWEHPLGGFFGPWLSIILKSSHQNLSYDESTFLSSLKIGHWVAQIWSFFDKLLEMRNFGLLQQLKDSEFTKFWPRAFQM